MKSILNTLFLLFAVCFSLQLSAQQHESGMNYCGYEGKSEWLERYQAGEFPDAATKSNEIRYVPMNIVLVGESDGTGYIRPERFFTSMELLNSDFRDQNIQFYINGDIQFLPNSRYNDHDIAAGREMMRINNINGAMNNYIVESPNGNCGYYSPSTDGIALGTNCMGVGDHTWAHEVGHYLRLPHTFVGWEGTDLDELPTTTPAPTMVRGREVEKADGSNCSTAADGFCDTPADYVAVRWPCTTVGMYRDSLMDPDTARFAVPAANIMSYAFDNCVSEFSPDQQAAMFANLDSRITLFRPTNPNAIAANVDDLEMISPANNDRLLYQDSVTLRWSSVENADFYVLELNDSRNLNGSVFLSTILSDTSFTIVEGLNRRRDYFWRVRPVNRYDVQSEFGEIFKFRNGSQLVSTIDAALDAAITIAPNPVVGGQTLHITGNDLGINGNMNYQLIDASGRVLVNREGIQVNASGFNENINTGNLIAGMYFLRIQLADKLVTRRIVITP